MKSLVDLMTKTTKTEKLDPTEVLKAADEIAQLEQQIKDRKNAMKTAVQSASKTRRKQIAKVLCLKDISPNLGYYDKRTTTKERTYMLDQLAKAHAAGRIVFPGLD